MTIAAVVSGAPTTVPITVTGHLETGAADFVYLPVEVPKGVQKIAVEYSYDKPSVPAGTPGNSCDIGIFDSGVPSSAARASVAGPADSARSSG